MSSASGAFKGCRSLLAAARAGAAKSSAAKVPAKPKPRSSESRNTKLFPVSPALGHFLGVPEVARPQAVKKIWDYAKLHNLQHANFTRRDECIVGFKDDPPTWVTGHTQRNPANKREIYCDDKLKTIFEGKDKVGLSDIVKLLSRHFVKTD